MKEGEGAGEEERKQNDRGEGIVRDTSQTHSFLVLDLCVNVQDVCISLSLLHKYAELTFDRILCVLSHKNSDRRLSWGEIFNLQD